MDSVINQKMPDEFVPDLLNPGKGHALFNSKGRLIFPKERYNLSTKRISGKNDLFLRGKRTYYLETKAVSLIKPLKHGRPMDCQNKITKHILSSCL